MISVIVYGRNDAHGYNLHRRAGLSLNCIAEVLTDPNDELLFVDYNTPDELPTFIEALSDTLTDHCVDLLRVLRVRPAIHEQRFAARTNRPAPEPVARNVAARRANPSNRWLLSTNTDMIFVTPRDRSMSEICRDLPDGFYALPRFELPEWLWESLPRTDPRRAVAEIARLGPRLRLDEPTMGHAWIRFDAPGDFQLILRDDFMAIDAFDEEMLLGYHVDSNLSRRLLLHRGSIESLEDQLFGYHCNHNRTQTHFHEARVTNDLDRFFYSVSEPALPRQRDSWGMPEVTVDEVPIRDGLSVRCKAALSRVIQSGPLVASDAHRDPHPLTYDSGHVLPHAIDTLLLSSLDARIGYLGVNSPLERMLRDVVDCLGFEHPMEAARFDDTSAVDEIAQSADVFIIDLGIDVSEDSLPADGRGQHSAASALWDIPAGLVWALPALDRLIEIERTRETVKHARPMMLVNSSAAFCNAYVLAQFDCSYTTFHSRVRRATVKPGHEVDSAAVSSGFERGLRMLRWFGREGRGDRRLSLPGESVDVGELEEYGGFGAGWTHPEPYGIWTEGRRAEVRMSAGESRDDDFVVTLTIGMVCARPNEPLRVAVLAGGQEVATRAFAHTDVAIAWRIEVPAEACGDREIELVVLVEDPCSPRDLGWSTDVRRLGILLQAITLEQVDRLVALSEEVEFCEGSGGERLLGDGWSPVDPTGVWTAAETARLMFRLAEVGSSGVDVVLDCLPFVTAEHCRLEVEVFAREECLAGQTFRYGATAAALYVHLPSAMMDSERYVCLDIRLRDPARPVDLGLGRDSRRLGLHLRSLTVRERAGEGRETNGVARRQESGDC
jgi:hypothetical protein